jgi:hypothetical protein
MSSKKGKNDSERLKKSDLSCTSIKLASGAFTAFHNNIQNCGISGCRKKHLNTATFFGQSLIF